jgi:predicted nucleic acid-binding protein
MQGAIISDTSCLILLENIGELRILNLLFGTILTTSQVSLEFGNPLPVWIKVVDPVNTNYQHAIEVSLDKGEASAIALAVEYEDCLLIIDDLKGRKFAIELGLNITGTLGILVEAKLAGHIPAIKPVLAKIRQTNFRLTRSLQALILARLARSSDYSCHKKGNNMIPSTITKTSSASNTTASPHHPGI